MSELSHDEQLCGGAADHIHPAGEAPSSLANGHGHHQGHSDAGHSHGVAADADQRYLLSTLVLLALFMVAEVVVAFVSGSLAPLSDAGHMLSDVGAIAAALWALEKRGVGVFRDSAAAVKRP